MNQQTVVCIERERYVHYCSHIRRYLKPTDEKGEIEFVVVFVIPSLRTTCESYISAMNPLPQPKHSSLYLYKCEDVQEHPFALIYINICMFKHTTALEPTQLYIS